MICKPNISVKLKPLSWYRTTESANPAYPVGYVFKTNEDGLFHGDGLDSHAQFGGYFGAFEPYVPPSAKDKNDGSNANYYEIPEGARSLGDIIDGFRLNFNQGNILKAIWRLGRKPGVSRSYDLKKIIYYAQRELNREANYV